MIAFVLGGVGLFLLGMSMLTDGLKELAGDVLKSWLNRFTGGTFSAILSGTIITAIIQSSSATTVMTISFVSAGLITFLQSIGVIIGANIGSTSTGWIVSLIGFKVNLHAVSLPIIGIGIFIKLFAKRRFKTHGLILAGFGLLFLGIKTLQDGMLEIEHWFVLDSLGDTFYYKILLVLTGIMMTVIMQSSSAAVVTTLTALHAGVVGFEQAAALVIGQNIGTTVTAVLASLGASISAKRTAFTHVFFNIGTGIVAILIFPLLVTLTVTISTLLNANAGAAFGIAIFHTLFNLIGVLLFVPFIRPFSNFVLKVIPEKANELSRYLDRNLVTIPIVALEASIKTLLEIIKELTEAILELIQSKKVTTLFENKVQKVEGAIVKTREFLSSVPSNSSDERNRHLSILHSLDHIDRLIKVLREECNAESVNVQGKLINEWQELLKNILLKINDKTELRNLTSLLERTSMNIAEERRTRRNKYFVRSIKRETELDTAISKVQALLWIDRLAFHYWRAIARIMDGESIEFDQLS